MAVLLLACCRVAAASDSFSTQPWRLRGALPQASLSASVLYYNNSFVLFGGCAEVDCATVLATAAVFSPARATALPSPLPPFSTGFAGPHAVVASRGSFYLLRSCSYYLGTAGASRAVLEAYGAIAAVSSGGAALNESVFQIPSHLVRANASCVALGARIFVIGGVNLTSLEPTAAIDVFNTAQGTYAANVAALDAAVSNAAVTTDGVTVFVAGGRTLSGPSSVVYAFYPGDGQVQPCLARSVLPPQQQLTGSEGTAMSIAAFGGFLLVGNENRTLFASADVRTGNTPSWTLFSVNTTEESPQRSSWGAVPQTVGNSSTLLLFRFGGTVGAGKAATLTPDVAASITSVALPTPQLASTVVSDGTVIFPLQGANESLRCSDPAGGNICQVRLSGSMLCDSDAVGTGPAQYVYPHRVGFVVTGQLSPVYVCFSYGAASASCPQAPAPAFPINLDSPLTVMPPNTPSPPAPSGGGHDSLVLYILGGVAALTTGMAVLLVARLKKKSPEGMFGGASGNYGSVQQEERYRIVSKIGEGTFSVVYLVHRRADGAKLALKHMECQSDLQRHEAIKECEIVRSLQGHPNVINLVDMFMNYEFDTARGDDAKSATENLNNTLLEQDSSGNKRSRHLCLVMQYHPVGDLRKWTLSQPSATPISESILLSVAFQVISVLKHCHAQDPPVIHRDLKPENILISHLATNSSTLPIVVTDFGLARVQEGTHCASGAGTVPYVAPECFKKKYTVQCDLWSLGCVMYAVATRRVNNNTVKLMFQEVGNPDFHASLRRDLTKLSYSELFIQLVLMLLEPQPTDRPTAAQAFRLFRKRKDEIFLSDKAMKEHKSGVTSIIPSVEERERHVPLPRNANSIDVLSGDHTGSTAGGSSEGVLVPMPDRAEFKDSEGREAFLHQGSLK